MLAFSLNRLHAVCYSLPMASALMNTPPENELDLEKLFLPAWAQEPASANLYAKYEGENRPERRDDRRGPRRPGQGPRPGGRPDARGGRPQGGRRPGGPEGGRPRFEGKPGERQERPGRWGGPRDQRERRPLPPPLPEVNLSLLPDDRGVDSLARQIKTTGRAYPLFEIAQMILQRPERLSAIFSVKKNAEGKPIQSLFVCALDDTLWLSEDEAVAHVLQKHFATFYQAERTATEPPKGKYTFVAQCGMSGNILGPPNYHDYQNQLHKLHAERFSRMPFEAFKARVKIVRDEEVVKKWVDEQSWKTEYVCLNMPEPLKLASMEAVEKHFRETHKENIIKQVESHTLSGVAARGLRSLELSRMLRSVTEDQKRFPLQIATSLSQQFAARGLQFFKVNRTITHVSVARPHYLDLEATPVSEGVKRIVDFINASPKCNRRLLVDALAPAPPRPAVLPVAPEPQPTAEGQPAAAPASPEPTPEQTAVIADLHWLVHQGHVIEFANGVLETAKKPLPKPPRPEPKTPGPAAQADSGLQTPSASQTEPMPSGEIASETVSSTEPVLEPPPATVETSEGSVEFVRPAELPSASAEGAFPEPPSAPAAEKLEAAPPAPVESPS